MLDTSTSTSESNLYSNEPLIKESRMIITDLPYDIIEHLFSYFPSKQDSRSPHKHVNSTLKECRLVCKAFNNYLLPIVFKDFKLRLFTRSPIQGSYRIDRLASLIGSNPNIAACVQTFTLLLQGHTLHAHTGASRKAQQYFYGSLELPVILPQLTGLRHFSFMVSDLVEWSHFSDQMATAIQNVFSLPHLTSVSLRDIVGFPFWNLKRDIARLEKLSIAFATFRSQGIDDGEEQSHSNEFVIMPPKLKHLTLSPGPFLDDIHRFQQLPSKPLSSLQTLKILHACFNGPQDIATSISLTQLLDSLATSLQELELSDESEFDIDPNDFWPTVNLNLFTSLYKIKILDEHCGCQQPDLPLGFITSLQCDTPVTSVHTLHIRVTCKTLKELNMMSNSWRKLDTIIKTTYPNLSTLILEFGHYDADDPYEQSSDKSARRYLETAMPWVSSNKSISIYMYQN